MSLYSTFKTNNTLEREGRWFEIPAIINTDGSKPGFKMSRMHQNNPAYQAAIEKLGKEFRNVADLDVVTNEIATPAVRAVFIETVLLDWRNVFNEDEQPIKFSPEAAEKLLADLPDLYVVLVGEAKLLANFRNAELDAVAKKSLPLSNQPTGKADT